MKRFYRISFYLGVLGYLTSIVLYALTFKDVNALGLPVYWPLTIVMFVIWLAAMLKVNAKEELKNLRREKAFNPLGFLKAIFSDTPVWMSALAGISFVFAMISFYILMDASPGAARIINGEYVLHSHGDIVKRLSEQEYKHELALNARMFLGHYIAFFGVGTAILYPERINESDR